MPLNESHTRAILNDVLLPKLLSGELPSHKTNTQ